jgi:hypothetical protein
MGAGNADQAFEKVVLVVRIDAQMGLEFGKRHRLRQRRIGRNQGHGCLRGGVVSGVRLPPPEAGRGVCREDRKIGQAANFRSLIASKFCTPPPTRLVV